MIVRTSLLITDDPDDHVEFSEALYEISDDMVVVTVSDINRAIGLLSLKRCIPDYIFVNTRTPESAPGHLFATLGSDPRFKKIKVITFGEGISADGIPAVALPDNLSYSELRDELRKIVLVPKRGE